MQLIVGPGRETQHQVPEITHASESLSNRLVSGFVQIEESLAEYPDRILQQRIARLKLFDKPLVEIDAIPELIDQLIEFEIVDELRSAE
jgi:hypothetical protein